MPSVELSHGTVNFRAVGPADSKSPHILPEHLIETTAATASDTLLVRSAVSELDVAVAAERPDVRPMNRGDQERLVEGR